MSFLERIEAERNDDLEMTPMIDVTFLLLVFFLLTLRFRTLEGKLAAYLPKDAGVNVEYVERVQLDVSIEVLEAGRKVNATGPDANEPWAGDFGRRFRVLDRRLAYRIGPRGTQDLETLTAWIAELSAANPEAPLTIAPGPGTLYGDVVPVLDAAVEAGCDEVTIAARPNAPR